MTGMLCLPPSRKRDQRDRFSISAAARVKSISGLGSSAKQQDRLTNFSSERGFKSCTSAGCPVLTIRTVSNSYWRELRKCHMENLPPQICFVRCAGKGIILDAPADLMPEAMESPVKCLLAWLPHVLLAATRLFAQTDSAGDPMAATESQRLEPERTIERRLAGGQSHLYAFTLQAGQYTRVRVEQRSVNVGVACHGPGGKELFAADAYQIGDAEDAELIGDISGDYRLTVAASDPGAPIGRYEITLEIATATERQRERVAAARAFALGMGSFRQGTREATLRALDHLSGALAHWRAAEDRVEVARTLCAMGTAYIEIGEQQKALEYTTQALAAAQAANDRRAEERALNAIGEVHNYFGDKRKAIGYYEQALPLMRTAGDLAGEANALNNVAVAYSHTGDKIKALALFGRAEQIFREIQDRRMIAEVTGNMGVTYDNLGEYHRALESHER